MTNTSGWKYDIPPAPVEDSLALAQKLDAGELRDRLATERLTYQINSAAVLE